MNTLDIILLVPLLYGLVKGLYKGLVAELASILSLAAGVLCAYLYTDELYEYLSEYVKDPGTGLRIASYAILFISVGLVVYYLGKLLTKLLKAMALGMVNRVLGGVFGTAKMLLIMLVLVYFTHPFLEKKLSEPDGNLFKESSLYPPLLEYSKLLDGYLLKKEETPSVEDLIPEWP